MTDLSWAGLFAVPEPEPSKVIDIRQFLPRRMPDCAYCGHPEKDHCKGGINHSNYKDAMRQVRMPRGSICVGRHCTCPLCCCTNYQETA
jgi:hypothetical protein